MKNANKDLSNSAQRVQDALTQKGVPFKVYELSQSTRTAHDAASSIGCNVAQIVKSLMFRTHTTHQPILILVSGMNRVNETMIEKIMGEKIVKADALYTRTITGFVIGGVPPVGHEQTINTILIDEDLLKFDTLWAAAGTPNAVFSLSAKDLVSITCGKICSIK